MTTIVFSQQLDWLRGFLQFINEWLIARQQLWFLYLPAARCAPESSKCGRGHVSGWSWLQTLLTWPAPAVTQQGMEHSESLIHANHTHTHTLLDKIAGTYTYRSIDADPPTHTETQHNNTDRFLSPGSLVVWDVGRLAFCLMGLAQEEEYCCCHQSHWNNKLCFIPLYLSTEWLPNNHRNTCTSFYLGRAKS